MTGAPPALCCQVGEDDLRWALAGAEYLLRVDAKTVRQQQTVESLRQRLTERIQRSEAAA